jgi:hypothetical protein
MRLCLIFDGVHEAAEQGVKDIVNLLLESFNAQPR